MSLDSILAGGFCFLVGVVTGIVGIWPYARGRFTREGMEQGAALQRERRLRALHRRLAEAANG